MLSLPNISPLDAHRIAPRLWMGAAPPLGNALDPDRGDGCWPRWMSEHHEMGRPWTLAVLLLTVTSGCITPPPKQPPFGSRATQPPTAAQIATCQSAKSRHNVWVLMGVIFSSISGAGGPTSALLSDKGQQIAVGIGAGATGILGAVAGTLAGFAADDYNQENCSTVLAPPP